MQKNIAVSVLGVRCEAAPRFTVHTSHFTLHNQTMTSATTIIKRYKNGGKVELYKGVDRKAKDFSKILASCKHFAKQGEHTVILPKIHKDDPLYREIYKDLIGTVYEKKCPDFLVGNKFYEHEGFTTNNPKRAFLNMISRGRQQSNRIVLDDSGYDYHKVKRYVRNSAKGRHPDGKYPITEVWVLDRNANLIRLF